MPRKKENIDKETEAAIESIMDGSLADHIGKRMKYSMSGIGIGVVAGIIAAAVTGQPRWMYALGGGVIGGGVGYMSSFAREKEF